MDLNKLYYLKNKLLVLLGKNKSSFYLTVDKRKECLSENKKISLWVRGNGRDVKTIVKTRGTIVREKNGIIVIVLERRFSMKYEMIIFDIDGTLWEASEITMIAANSIADEYKEIPKVSIEDIYKVMGLGKRDIAQILMPNVELSKAMGYVDLQTKLAIDLINKNGAHIYENVSSVIKYLSKKYKLGIITNNFDDYVKLFLEKSNLKRFFIDYIGNASYGISKKEAIEKMMSRNNVSLACYIGDIKKDMQAAYDANIDFIHAKYGFEPNLECEKIINDISELKEML